MSIRATDLFNSLRSLDLPNGECAVFGSRPLIVRGIVDATNDLDVVCRRVARERARGLGKIVTLVEHDVDVVSFLDGAITVGISWAFWHVDIDELTDTPEVIDGLPFARLEPVVRCKKIAGRLKDLEHLRLLDASNHGTD